MAKSLSVLLSMLLLISAAQVEAKLQIISNNELKQHSEKRGAEKAPAQKAIADNSKQTTESYVSKKNLLILFSGIGGVLAVAGHKIVLKTVKAIYGYFKGETTERHDREDRKGQGDNPSGNRQNGDQHGKSQSSPAVPVSSGSSKQGEFAPLSRGAADNLLKAGAKSFLKQDDSLIGQAQDSGVVRDNQVITEEGTNIDVYPETKRTWLKNAEITIGDLHASATKMLYFLVKEGVIQVSEEHYQAMLEISSLRIHMKALVDGTKEYNALISFISKEEMDSFKEALSHAERGPSAEVLVRFIGDMLADRGSNDGLILLILNQLNQLGINYEILVSNHDVAFLSTFGKWLKSKETMLKDSGFKQDKLEDQAQSVIEFSKFLKQNPQQVAEFEGIVKTALIPKLKLLSYSKGRVLSYYSHAPVNLDVIVQKFCKYYEIAFTGNIPDSIDQINGEFNSRPINQDLIEFFTGKRENPFKQVIWSRGNPGYDETNHQIKYIHGHDKKTEQTSVSVNLDNSLGQWGSVFDCRGDQFLSHTGTYSIYGVGQHAQQKATPVGKIAFATLIAFSAILYQYLYGL